MVKEGKIDEALYRALEKAGKLRSRDDLVEAVGFSIPQRRFSNKNSKGYARVEEELVGMGYEMQEH